MEFSTEMKDIIDCYVRKELAGDECFCMVLSLVGYEETKRSFLRDIDGIKLRHPELYTQLVNVYCGYFNTPVPPNLPDRPPLNLPDRIDCAVENGFYATDGPTDSDLGFDLDLELALKLSTEDHKQLVAPHSESGVSYSRILVANIAPSYIPDKQERKQQYMPSVPAQHENHRAIKVESNVINSVPIKKETNNHLVETKSQKKKNRRKGKNKNDIERPLSNPPVICWFRRDLRVYDNPALVAASQTGAPVIPLFLWSDAEEGTEKALATGGASKYWLYMALPAFNRDMVDKYSNPIIFRKSESYLSDLTEIVQATGARTLFINDVYEPYLKSRDEKICKSLKSKGVKCERFHSYLLHEPGSIRTECLSMRGIGSVSHFMECCRQSSKEPIGSPLDPPSSLPEGSVRPFSMPFDDLDLGKLPKRKDGTVIDWAKDIRAGWDFSENGAWEALQLFLGDGVRRYEKESSRGDQLNTSRISPYLHWGQISPRTVLSEGRFMKSPKFLRKLAWRDLSYWLLSIFPDLPHEPTRPQYIYQRWSSDKAGLKAWQKGNTGYPLVDASMRQLWLTGWMNNYMRHVVASFLISYMHFSWVEGYLWFQDTLLDADVAINAMMWQNGGMSGLDQWNFVMHPVDAAMTCDPKGDFVRKWIPELARMPEEFIHKPWKCPPSILRRCGVQLGVNYPQRIIVDLETAREQSLKDVVKVRQMFQNLIDPRTGNDIVYLPSGIGVPCITRREFKFKTRYPDSRENPHDAVLKGYRSRKRDEFVADLEERDFMASTMKECSTRHERGQKTEDMSLY